MVARKARPGQFVHLRLSDEPAFMLRRPFSIHRCRRDCLQILYQVVGQGTESLSRVGSGQTLDLIGPLGEGFPLPRGTRSALLVAGGMGIAPLLFWAEILLAPRRGRGHPAVTALLGAASRSSLLCRGELRKLGVRVHVSTEDGSLGFRGLVTELLQELMDRDMAATSLALYACGPKAMLSTPAALAKERKIPCFVSLEERMACGVGACQGCVVRVRTHGAHGVQGVPTYARVCKDGPVFSAGDIIWE